MKINKNYKFASFVWVSKISHIKVKWKILVVWEQGAEENIGPNMK
jgi:hypothetical protein